MFSTDAASEETLQTLVISCDGGSFLFLTGANPVCADPRQGLQTRKVRQAFGSHIDEVAKTLTGRVIAALRPA
jgi:hypothetical protein